LLVLGKDGPGTVMHAGELGEQAIWLGEMRDGIPFAIISFG
jgi:hypothetical protein